MEPISVLLVDDNPTFLQATTQFLSAHDDITVIGAARSGEEALMQISLLQPEVILVDLAMVGLSGLEVIPRIRSLMPMAGIVALTLLDVRHFREAALKAGADDFVPKATMRTELLPAIRRVARNGIEELPRAPESASTRDTLPTRRILVMEDNPDLCRLYSKALAGTGYQVYAATSIQEAQQLLQQYRFDIMLCDIHIGAGRGTDLLREHAAALATSGTQVIMVSGQAQYRDMCEELGADFFLEKPVAISTLVGLVNRLTAHR
jgi:CheY-like chemotaxis protein